MNASDHTPAFPGLVLLGTPQLIVAPVAYVDFIGLISALYDEYELHYSNAIPGADNAQPQVRTSADGGATFASTGLYNSTLFNGSSNGGSNDGIAMSVVGVNGVGNAANENGASGKVTIHRPGAANYTHFTVAGTYTKADGSTVPAVGGGRRLANGPINALRFIYDITTIASGDFRLYGVRKS